MSAALIVPGLDALKAAGASIRRWNELMARAYAASPRAKAERSKEELMSLLAARRSHAEQLAAVRSPRTSKAFALTAAIPRERSLVASHGPHAPPGRSATAERLRTDT